MSTIKISESEWQVMNVVWARSPISAAEVVEALGPKTGWHSRTIRTLLDRLVQKKALKINAEGKPNLYAPRISREAGQRQESQSFVRRVFGGEPAAMLLHLIGEAKLSKEEVRKLKDILTEKEK